MSAPFLSLAIEHNNSLTDVSWTKQMKTLFTVSFAVFNYGWNSSRPPSLPTPMISVKLYRVVCYTVLISSRRLNINLKAVNLILFKSYCQISINCPLRSRMVNSSSTKELHLFFFFNHRLSVTSAHHPVVSQVTATLTIHKTKFEYIVIHSVVEIASNYSLLAYYILEQQRQQ